MEKIFYVYKWFNTETGEVFYIGKGSRNRYKEINHRNQYFLEYYNNNPCSSEIIGYFNSEEEAFKKESELIKEYREKNQAKTNLDDGGKGGCHFVWTPQMKEYWSENNPMKRPEQRERMIKNNPMKNPEIANKVAEKNRAIIIIDNIEYESFAMACEKLNISEVTLANWCKRGHTSEGKKCYYKDDSKRHDKIHRKTDRLVLVDDILFNTITDAAAYLDCSASNLGASLRKGKTTYKNHKIKYANQQPSQENSNNSNLEGSTTNE